MGNRAGNAAIAVFERMDGDEPKVRNRRLQHAIDFLRAIGRPVRRLWGLRSTRSRPIDSETTCIEPDASVRQALTVILFMPLRRPVGNKAACQPNNRSALRGVLYFPVASSIISTMPSTLRSGGVRAPISILRRRASDERTCSRLRTSPSISLDLVTSCFLEAVLRDPRDGADGSLLLSEDELQDRHYAPIEIASPLNMGDLRGDGAVRMGVPTDVARASRQTLARHWSLAWHEHPSGPDGIVYPSRLNGQTNLAIFDRAVPKLKAIGVQPLIGVAGVATVLDDLMVKFAP